MVYFLYTHEREEWKHLFMKLPPIFLFSPCCASMWLYLVILPNYKCKESNI